MKYLAFFALGLLLAACGGETQQVAEVQVITPSAFKKLLETSPKAVLVDVRTPGEFERGSITGAINLDFRAPDFKDQLAQLPKDQPIFLYCSVGGRSKHSANLLEKMGFREIYDLDGGYTRWAREFGNESAQ